MLQANVASELERAASGSATVTYQDAVAHQRRAPRERAISMHEAPTNVYESTRRSLEELRAEHRAKVGTDLMRAVADQNAGEVKFLIAAGVDVNFADEEGNTPLHIPCLKDNVHIAYLLLKAGANMYAKNKDGVTPYAIAFDEKVHPSKKVREAFHELGVR